MSVRDREIGCGGESESLWERECEWVGDCECVCGRVRERVCVRDSESVWERECECVGERENASVLEECECVGERVRVCLRESECVERE